MNKLFTKIAALALGATMTVGVGVAVASSGKAANQVLAANSTYQKVSSLAANKEVLIVSHSTSGQYYLMDAVTAATSAGPKYITCSLSDSKITGDYDSHLFTVSASSTNWKFATGSKYLKWSGTSSNTAVRINTGDSNNTWTYSSGTMKFSSATRYLGVYTAGSDWRSYNSSTAANYSGTGANIEFYEKVAAKTLSSISLSGTYPTSFAVGDSFDHTGMTVTAHYSDSTTANVTSSATFSGYNMSTAGNQTVTVSYTESGTTKTATYSITVSAPTTPTLSLDKASFSGYTGQSFSVTATFANLESDLAWSASGTGSITGGSITWSSSDHRNGTSTYTCTLSGEGGKTIVADADGVDAAQCVVTITQTTVNITKASTSIAQGKNETLAVSHNASSVDGLTWTSSDTSGKIDVDSNGKVTVANDAVVGSTATITATSKVDTNVSDTCTVTVTEAPLEYEIVFGTAEGTSGITDFSNTSYVIPSGVTLNNIQGNVYSNTSNQAASLRFGKSGTTGSFDATISGNYYITSVKCNLKYYGSDSTATFAVTPDGGSAISKSLTASWEDYTYDVSAAKAKTITLGTDVNGKRAYLSGFTISYAAQKTLSNIALSGTYPTTFTKGDTFSHSGMVVTANYSDSTSATVTSSATWSTPDMSTTGAKTVTVSYSDEYGSASTTYSITVNYAAPTSITLSSYSTNVALEETFDLSDIEVTINPSATADQTAYAWSLYDDGGLVEDEDYVWISPEIMSYKAGTFVFRCTSTEDGTKYAEFTLEVSDNPIAHLKDEGDQDVTDGSMTVFADAGIISFQVIAENFQGTLTYTWSSSNTSIIDIDADADEMCDYEVIAAGSARLSCRIQGSVKGDVTVYVDVTVSAVSVTSVTWTAPTIDVFSGATLTTSDVSSWNVKYSTDSGKTDQSAPVGSTTVKIGGSAVSLPHTWVAADNGKTLGVEYGGVSSSTTTVTVTQTINAVYAPNTSTDTVSWTASEAADLGSKISSQGGTDEGTISTGDYEWDYTRTLVSLASNKSDYIAFQGETWIQLGSGNALESLEFTTSAIPGTIKSVSVVAATAGTHALTIDVGGTKYLEDESLHVYTGTAAASNPDPADCVKTGTGSSSGAITITIAQSGSTKKAMVIRSISVTYETEGSGTTNIANNASHKAAQRAAVAYAQAFNAAMDETENCTTGLDAAWSTCSSAYTAFKSAAAALGSTEEAWAKNLIKYATVEWSDDSGEACIERMMKTYEVCVQKHGKTAFMSDLVTLGRVSNTNPISLIGNNVDTNTVAIIVIVSVISVSAIGGYFFLRKRKENN